MDGASSIEAKIRGWEGSSRRWPYPGIRGHRKIPGMPSDNTNLKYFPLNSSKYPNPSAFSPSTPPKRTIYRWWTPRSTWPTGPCNRTVQESAGWNTSVTCLAVTFFDSSTVATSVSPYPQHGAQRPVKSKHRNRIHSWKEILKLFFFFVFFRESDYFRVARG